MDDSRNETTMLLLQTLEQHAYMRLAELIDGNHIAEAGQLVTVLKEVGLI